MDQQTALILLRSLLERLEADAQSVSPRLAAYISPTDVAALRFLLSTTAEKASPTLAASVPPPASSDEVVALGDDQTIPIVEQQTVVGGADSDAGEQLRAAKDGGDDAFIDKLLREVSEAPSQPAPIAAKAEERSAVQSPAPEATMPGPRSSALRSEIKINEHALSLHEPEDQDLVLCLDFGTAKSKAFAASTGENPSLLDLGLGQRDHDVDGAVFGVSSSVWIDDDGLMFAGSEAFRRGAEQVYANASMNRRRLDSLKQELSQVLQADTVTSRLLSQDVNPSGIKLTYDDAITFYLAYLTDLAGNELEERHRRSRYVRRRFALPCWPRDHRLSAARLLSKRLGQAQVLADTFHGHWKDGIHAAEVKRAIETVSGHDLAYLIATKPALPEESPAKWGALLEPLAAGSARVWTDKGVRDLVLVVDIGAGTTDFSLFLVLQRAHSSEHRAYPVEPCASAIRMAGDTLDSALVAELLERARLGADEELERRVRWALYQSGVRRLKEQLFTRGELRQRLINDQHVTITRDEFLRTERVQNFTSHLAEAIGQFLNSVDESWSEPMSNMQVVLTGGGSDLPMVRDLLAGRWLIRNTSMAFALSDRLPEFLMQRFGAEYPQLAVAIGGALPTILDEARAQAKWHGGAPPPGPLDRYQVTGL